MSLYLGNTPIAVSSPSHNIGEIIQSTIPLSDAGLHLLDGSLINGAGSYSAFVTYIAGLVSNYPDLFITETAWQQAVTDYGVCGKFVYDSTNNTVRLPKITGFTEGTTDVTALGDLIEAGLPNITSTRRVIVTSNGNDNGCITNTISQSDPGHHSNNYGLSASIIDASRSSSIYGRSNTVQPQAIKVLYYIVIANSVKTNIEVDIDEVMTDLNGKVSTSDLATCHVVIETYNNGTDWYRIWSDGWCEQGGELSTVNQDSTTNVNLLQPYINTNYSVLITATGGKRSSTQYMNGNAVASKNMNSFVMQTNDYAYGRIWRACGYIS